MTEVQATPVQATPVQAPPVPEKAASVPTAEAQEQAPKVDGKLVQAAQEIEQLTPQDWIEVQDYITKLESNAPESMASINFYGKTEVGWDLQLTIRGMDEGRLLDRFASLSARLQEKGVKPKGAVASTTGPASQPAPTAPATAPAATAPGAADGARPNLETFPVDTVNHQIAQNGNHYLLVKGGPFTRYGWKAWAEVVPNSLDFENWGLGVDYKAPPELANAWVDKEKKKIVSFGGAT